MYDAESLLDLHERAHRNLKGLLSHCRELSAEEIDRELPGFGYPTVRLQLHHGIGAEEYWIGVLKGHFEVEENEDEYPTIESLEKYRHQVCATTDEYLRGASTEELNTPRKMKTWRGKEPILMPAHVFIRTLTHLYHHQGQVVAMCRLVGKPVNGLDFPLG